MNQVILYLLWAILALVIIIGVWITIGMLLPVHGQTQNTTPPKVTTSPPNPTPTTPAPNFQYLPQKAFVVPFSPENGVPNVPPLGTPLATGPVQPTVVAPVQQPVPVQNSTGIPTDLMGYLAAAGAAFAYLKGHLVGKKTDKNEEVTREQSQQIIKGAEVDQSLANQVYQNMDDKGASIHDKPEIKLENLAKDREAAIKTATKA